VKYSRAATPSWLSKFSFLEGQKAGSSGESCDDLEPRRRVFSGRREHAEQLFRRQYSGSCQGQFSRGGNCSFHGKTGKYKCGPRRTPSHRSRRERASDFSVLCPRQPKSRGADFAGRCLEHGGPRGSIRALPPTTTRNSIALADRLRQLVTHTHGICRIACGRQPRLIGKGRAPLDKISAA